MFKICSSSAGSGKTYTLTKEYLKLALGPGVKEDYFRHILAVTFTNAAANEMKSRILDRLRDMAAGQESPLLTDLVTDLYDCAPGTDAFTVARAELCQRADRVFKTILHRYADFAVTTIDSFTQRVVMAFTDELGLPYSFEVEMDTDETLELAVDSMIEKAGVEEMDEITTILSDYFSDTAAEGKSWNQLPETLREFGKNLTSDQFYEAVNAAQELSPAALRVIRQQVQDFNTSLETDVIAHAQRAWQRITDAGLSEADFSYGIAGVGGFLKGVAAGEARKDAGTRVGNAINNGQWYTKKTPLPVQGIIDDMADELTDCIRQLLNVRSERGEQAALFNCLLPHLQKLALLKQMRIEFDELLRKDGRVHISEFNKKILGIVASEPVPFLYEKLGEKYNHILIDEFQDTSRLQFANLLPLIENALGAQHLNLAVGDGKQAIYRFRGGDMDQIVALHGNDLDGLKQAHGPDTFTADRIGMLAGHLTGEILGTNWRSAAPIVRFNNQFFEHTARRYDGDHAKVADVFDAQQLFHQQVSPRANKAGHVQIDFLAKDDETGKDLTAVMVDKTVALLQKALADGYQYGDIAILCRKRGQARTIANALNARRIPLTSADSLSLEFSDPVKWIVTLMRLLLRPDNKLLRYELLYLFQRVVRGVFPDDDLTAELRTVAETGPDAVYDYLTKEGFLLDPYALGQLNPYELAERLTAQFGLFEQAESNPFLFRFLDEVLTFNQKRSGHLADFVLYWDSVRQKISVEGNAQNAVSIQTIHKAKGLEFPVVIIPFANWEVTPMAKGTIWLDLSDVDTDRLTHQTGTGEQTRLLSAPANTNSNLNKTPAVVKAQYTEEVTRTFLENMNLLYVAFTRPTDRLYILAERAVDFMKPGSQKDVSYWLHAFLRDSDTARTCGCGWEEGRSCYELSLCADAHTHRPVEKTDGVIIVDDIISGHRKQELNLRRQADRVFDVATFARTRERDRKLSAALSLIKGPGCIDKTLRRLVSEGLIRQLECTDLRARLTRIVTHPDLASLFDASLRIDTDRSILSRKRLHGAPHRVVHLPMGQVVLVQYQSYSSEPDPAGRNPLDSLVYFTNLYRDMGFAEVTGRLVYLSDEPEVVFV